MSYQSMASLAEDEGFQSRVLTCSSEQALVFKDSMVYSIKAFADAVIANQNAALPLFHLVCVAPGMSEKPNSSQITDQEILSNVQAQWPVYAETAYPEPPPAP